MSLYYTYVYLDTRKPGPYTYGSFMFAFEPFYVGKGTKNRYKEHLWEVNADTNRNKNPHKKYIISKIRRETGSDPLIVFPHTAMLAAEVKTHEQALIRTVGRRDLNVGPLVNLTDGGDGMLGRAQPVSQKQKVGLALRGRKKTERHVESMRVGNIAKRKSWLLTDAAGVEYVVDQLAEFCVKHNLAYREMLKVAAHHRGNKTHNRASTHRGWVCIQSHV